MGELVRARHNTDAQWWAGMANLTMNSPSVPPPHNGGQGYRIWERAVMR